MKGVVEGKRGEVKYRDSGVDIEKAKRVKEEIAREIRSTWGGSVLSSLASFGSMFRLEGYRAPVIVASMDGVGTKLMVAAMAGCYDTVGVDLVNHCVNDILVQGARPLFFMDYIAAGKLDPDQVRELIRGLARGCRQNSCALLGGETAEMPGLYREGDFDLAGCIVGVVEREEVVDGTTIAPGDMVFGLPSSGLHTNGYSLARKVFFEILRLGMGDYVEELGTTVGDELLKVHTSYLQPVLKLLGRVKVKGMAHVTGGGVVDNLARVVPGTCDALIRKGSWSVPPVFRLIQEKGEVGEEEMYRVFNMGLGFIVVLGKEEGKRVKELEGEIGLVHVGEIVSGRGKVRVE